MGEVCQKETEILTGRVGRVTWQETSKVYLERGTLTGKILTVGSLTKAFKLDSMPVKGLAGSLCL